MATPPYIYPYDPGVHSAKETLPLSNGLTHCLHILHQPLYLEGTEVGVYGQTTPGLVGEGLSHDTKGGVALTYPQSVLRPCADHPGDQVSSPAVTPHEGIVQTMPSPLVPQDGGLTLIGKPHPFQPAEVM